MKTSINEYFDKIYIINTFISSDERKQNVNNLLKYITNYKIVYGLNFGCLTPDLINVFYKHYWGEKNRIATANSFSCTISHYNCLLDAYINDYSKILILEDDVKFNIKTWEMDDFIIPENIDCIKFIPIYCKDNIVKTFNKYFIYDNTWNGTISGAYLLNSKAIKVFKTFYEEKCPLADVILTNLEQYSKMYDFSYCYCNKNLFDLTYSKSSILWNCFNDSNYDNFQINIK